MLIEGLASRFLETDLSGDRVRPGAFAQSLKAGRRIPMLFRHRGGAVAGMWDSLRETGLGLEVRGVLSDRGQAARDARRAIAAGMDGLSIGFRPKTWRYRPDGGRDLIEVDLVEISLVSEPMAPGARFRAM